MARKDRRTEPRPEPLPAGVYRVRNGISFPAPTDDNPKAEAVRVPGDTVAADELTPEALVEYIRHGDLEAPAASGPAVDESLNLPAAPPASEE